MFLKKTAAVFDWGHLYMGRLSENGASRGGWRVAGV